MRNQATIVMMWLLVFTSTCSWSQTTQVETFTMQHRGASEIIPIITPFLAPDDVIQGEGNKLVVRTDSARLSRIQALVYQFDSPRKRILISVKMEDELDTRTVNREQPSPPDDESDFQDQTTRTTTISTGRKNPTVQYVQALEGKPAWVRIGQSIPVGERRIRTSEYGVYAEDSIHYKNVNSGFYVVATLFEPEVSITINPFHKQPSPQDGGVINNYSLNTTMQGPIGEWVNVSGTGTFADDDGTRIVYRTASRSEHYNRIMIKVDVLH